MVVEPDIAHQRGLQVLGAIEAMGGQHLGDAAIETLDHAMGLRCTGLGQAVFDTQRLAELIELMMAGGLPVLGTEQSVRELLAVVGCQVPPDY